MEDKAKLDAQLSEALQGWVVEPTLPPRFQEQVWRRIAGGESRPASLRGNPVQWLIDSFARPKFAFSYLAVLVAVGVSLGSVTARLKSTQIRDSLGARYVQSIDPYLSAHAAR